MTITAIISVTGNYIEHKEAKAAEEKKENNPYDVDKDDPLLILVNKDHGIKKNYVPDGMKNVKYFSPTSIDEGIQMNADAAEAFDAMCEAAREEGHEVVCTTGYRSYKFQKELYEFYVSQKGEKRANYFSAKPGHSEHQTGLAVDVSSPVINYELAADFINTEDGQWIDKNSYKYGFIVRYPESRKNETGYIYEPWHLRYVGEKYAKRLYDKNISLEEFLGED